MADLHFLVPVRHPRSVADWSSVQAHLSATVASIAAQTTPNWVCHVIANTEAELPPLPYFVEVRRIDMPLPCLPDRRTDTEAFYDAVRRDKGVRLYAAARDVPGRDFVMVVDFDDFVSRRLAGLAAANPQANGWYVDEGYVYSGGRVCFAHGALHRLCGSTLIVRRDLLDPLTARNGGPDIAAVKRRLGSHVFLKADLEAAGAPLAPVPFPGAVYRVGNAQSTSGAGGVVREMSPRWLARKDPAAFVKSLFGYRPVTAAMRQEFGLPAPAS